MYSKSMNKCQAQHTHSAVAKKLQVLRMSPLLVPLNMNDQLQHTKPTLTIFTIQQFKNDKHSVSLRSLKYDPSTATERSNEHQLHLPLHPA